MIPRVSNSEAVIQTEWVSPEMYLHPSRRKSSFGAVLIYMCLVTTHFVDH